MQNADLGFQWYTHYIPSEIKLLESSALCINLTMTCIRQTVALNSIYPYNIKEDRYRLDYADSWVDTNGINKIACPTSISLFYLVNFLNLFQMSIVVEYIKCILVL